MIDPFKNNFVCIVIPSQLFVIMIIECEQEIMVQVKVELKLRVNKLI